MEPVKEAAKKAAQGAAQHKKYCALITIDIKNAFNTASWTEIVGELQVKRVSNYLVELIKSYLSEREIIVGRKVA